MGKPHILLVEDESIVAMDMSRRLKAMGYSTIGHVASGKKAFEYAMQKHPDLILMDIQLKGELDGIHTAELIRQEMDVPVIYITAYGDDETFSRAKAAGAYGYILKPFQEREVRSSIEIALYIHKIQFELYQTKIAADEANKVKDRFLTKISHELRTPLNSILGVAELGMESSAIDEQRNYFRIVQKEGHHLLQLINTIINFSQIAAGKAEYTNVDFSIRELADDLIEQFRDEVAKKNLHLKYHLDHKGPQILNGDSSKLRQVLMYVIGNAVKFTNSGYIKVDVSTHRLKKTDRVRVIAIIEDTGCGISVKEKEEIYTAFNQGDNSDTRIYGGLGLGLTVVKQLVKSLDGDISFESEQNKGTTFKIETVFKESDEML